MRVNYVSKTGDIMGLREMSRSFGIFLGIIAGLGRLLFVFLVMVIMDLAIAGSICFFMKSLM